MATGEKIWGLHKFHAENADEVSFDVGETILVVEKDDAYGDGWWQGTNERGETGLFPFSYATTNRELAENAKALALSAGETSPNAGAPPPSAAVAAGAPPGVMNSTMADVDQAITELRGQRNASNGSNAAADRSRRSFQSERTADLSADDDATEDGESEYQARTNARAALAAKAKANAALSEKKDREEQERMRLHAKKVFEEEEARHRQLLLQKEQERKEAAAMGQLPTESDKRKVAPIEGVDMSDDSDSEGSANGLDTYTSATAAPAKLSSSSASPAAGRLALDESERAHVRDTSVKDELDDAPVNPSAAGAAAKSTQATGSTAATTLGDSQRGPSLDSAQQRSQSDQQSLTASTRPSHPDTASIGGGTGTHTAATSSAGKDTPKSISAPFAAAPVGGQGSPAPSVSASNRPAAPAGDAQDWSVDQVVEWARSKGWDENAVVSKFQEHEISGDVLLEMDVNILKEIDIVAFGKRFQVANAIKELKGHVNLSPSAGFGGAPPSSSSGRVLSSAGQSHHSTDSQPAAAASSAAAAAAGLGAYQGVGLGVPGGENDAAAVTNRAISYDAGTVIHHGSPALQQREREFSGSSMPPLGSTDASQGMSLAAMADAALLNRQGNNLSPPPRQQQQQQSGGFPSSPSANASPRKRSSKMSGSAERTSFFGGFNPRQRKPPAATPQSTIAEDGKSGKGMGTGTLSRFGLNRSLKNGQQQGSGDFKNQISLPTSSPTYDSEGDTARRNRASAASTNSNTGGRALGGYEAAVGGGHGRQASVGSAAPEQPKASTFNPNDPQEASGPVIARIRPVDVEGWMRKKGERYNSWKPRYLALKGSDLVILRDPQAQKIKGYVSMKGYKVIADENTNPGKYGFKILHESEKPHYFSSDDPILVREWMKGLMKATIGRDPNFPVISSYNNATISLKEAQSMYPPPRPPSPASRLRTQRAKARENPGELTEKDQAVLMGISQPQKGQAGIAASTLIAHSDFLSTMEDSVYEETAAWEFSPVERERGGWSGRWRKRSMMGLGGNSSGGNDGRFRGVLTSATVDSPTVRSPNRVERSSSPSRKDRNADDIAQACFPRSDSQTNLSRWQLPGVPTVVNKALAKMKPARSGAAGGDGGGNPNSGVASDGHGANDGDGNEGDDEGRDSLTEERLLDLPLQLSPSWVNLAFMRSMTPDAYELSTLRNSVGGRGQIKHWIRTTPDNTAPLNIMKLSDEYEQPRGDRKSASHIVSAPAASSTLGHRRNQSASAVEQRLSSRNEAEQASKSASWGLTKYEKILGLVPGPPPDENELKQQYQQLPLLPIPMRSGEVINIMNGRGASVAALEKEMPSLPSTSSSSSSPSPAPPGNMVKSGQGIPCTAPLLLSTSMRQVQEDILQQTNAELHFEDDGHGLPRARSTSDIHASAPLAHVLPIHSLPSMTLQRTSVCSASGLRGPLQGSSLNSTSANVPADAHIPLIVDHQEEMEMQSPTMRDSGQSDMTSSSQRLYLEPGTWTTACEGVSIASRGSSADASWDCTREPTLSDRGD